MSNEIFHFFLNNLLFYFMQTSTQNKSSQTKIFYLREFPLPLHIPIFVPLHLPIFCWFYFNFHFTFFFTNSNWQKSGIFREGCKDFLKAIPGSSLQAQGTQPQFIYSSFPRG